MALIVLLGFFLRLYQIGRDSFWADETAQAFAISEPTIPLMFKSIRSEVMMMPLDFFVGRGVAQTLGTTEGLLRGPSLLWGTLSILVLFFLARHVTNARTALLASFLLSISTIYIRYSQEFRPYASLLFFTLLSTYLLFKAIQLDRFWNWLLFFVVTLVGIYFHIYVYLVVVIGYSILFFRFLTKNPIRRQFIILSILSGLLFIFLLPAYFYFGTGLPVNFELLAHDKILWVPILKAIQWQPSKFIPTDVPVFGPWEAINIIFGICGLFYLVKDLKTRQPMMALVIGSLVQIGLILAADIIKTYWFIPRQLLQIAPFMIITASYGLFRLFDDLSNKLKEDLCGLLPLSCG